MSLNPFQCEHRFLVLNGFVGATRRVTWQKIQKTPNKCLSTRVNLINCGETKKYLPSGLG